MATLDELEAELRKTWDRGTLAVYADLLQSAGELRGELIAIDLRIEEAGALPELVARRKELLAAWLRTLPPGKVQHGFLDVDATGGDPIEQVRAALASPGAPYIRTVAIVGPPRVVREALAILAAVPRPALVRLVIRQWNDEPTPTLDAAAVAALFAATPNLHTLEIDGYCVLAAGTHPSLRRLRISGWNAVAALWDRGPAWAQLGALDFAVACHLGSQHEALPRAENLLVPTRVPALHALDLSRNEPGHHDPISLGGDTNWFRILRRHAILRQLRELRLPAATSEAQRANLRGVLAALPALEKIAIRGSAEIEHPTATIEHI